ncbi:MAG: type II toxin-antitoxin system HicB family antitoxin [Deltaproteobacteria bacterium]|nr:type II toxin-antitoxin system HicB family antitoxin [Deltaproteobacteria bacterium]
MADIIKSPEEYIKKPYLRIVIPDEESGTYTAQILEFPGCITQGETPQEAYERLEEIALSWIEAALSMGQNIPLPWSIYEYGGKVALRLPKSLHKQTVLAAERDGTSLNQFIVMAISEKIGASKFYTYLVEEFDRRLTQTAANVTNIILSNYLETIPSLGNENRIITYGTPVKKPELARMN